VGKKSKKARKIKVFCTFKSGQKVGKNPEKWAENLKNVRQKILLSKKVKNKSGQKNLKMYDKKYFSILCTTIISVF
jgi:hypothetical protein